MWDLKDKVFISLGERPCWMWNAFYVVLTSPSPDEHAGLTRHSRDDTAMCHAHDMALTQCMLLPGDLMTTETVHSLTTKHSRWPGSAL